MNLTTQWKSPAIAGVRMLTKGRYVMSIFSAYSLNYSTPPLPHWLLTPLRKSSYWLCFISSVAFTLAATSMGSAQSTSNIKLPPPPPVSDPKTAVPTSGEERQVIPNSTVPIPVIPPNAAPIREYTFEAQGTLSSVSNSGIPLKVEPPPQSVQTRQPTQLPQQTATSSLYRVVVRGSHESLLSQVRLIEPLAFIRKSERVIQAGLFQQPQQAQQRVHELKQKGVSATVVPVYQGGKSPLSVQIGRN